MLRFVADENFNNVIVRGLRRRLPAIDIVRVQDVGLLHADDPTILARAADEDWVVLTHDVNTMPAYAIERLDRGLSSVGVVVVRRTSPMALVIDDLTLLAECGGPEDFIDPVVYLPLR